MIARTGDTGGSSPQSTYVDRPPTAFFRALVLSILFPLPLALTAHAQPIPTKIDASLAFTCGERSITVFGQNLEEGATVKLTRAGQPDIVGTTLGQGTLQDGSNLLRCWFDISDGTAGGDWSVVVTNPDSQSGTLVDTLEIVPNCPRGAEGDLYVSNNRMWNVLQFDGETGEFVCIFADLTTAVGESDNARPGDLIWAPNGNLWVTTVPPFQGPSVVLEFDGNTGEFIDFVGPALPSHARSMSIGGDNGDLFIQWIESSWSVPTREYQRGTGWPFLGIPVAAAPPMINPFHARFASNGNFLVTGNTLGSPRPTIRAYDGQTFELLNEWVDNGDKNGLQETPDGCCYAVVERDLARIELYDIDSLQFVNTLIPGPPEPNNEDNDGDGFPDDPHPCGNADGGFAVVDPEACWARIDQPYDLAYGPNGHLFVAALNTMVPSPSMITGSFSMGAVHEFDPATGTQVRVIGQQDFFSGNGNVAPDKLYRAVWIEFKPMAGDFSSSGSAFPGDWRVDENDLARFATALHDNRKTVGLEAPHFIAANLQSFDMNHDGVVDCVDWPAFADAFEASSGFAPALPLPGVDPFIGVLLGNGDLPCLADRNGDGTVDGGDIAPFIAAMIGP